jgi:DNA-binding transcriptional LysR family regulator
MLEPKDIDLNLLVVFHELFHEQHVSKVAHKLHLSQSAVSNALARLRKTFDDELFVRTAKGMQATPLALQLAEPIANALLQVSQALNQQTYFDASTSTRHFKIAMTDVGEMYFLPRLIQTLQHSAPHVRLSTLRISSTDIKQAMESGGIDLAIAAFDEISESLYQKRLFKQDYVTLYRQGHPFAGPNMSKDAYLNAQHLIVDSRESPYDKINACLSEAGISTHAHYSVPHFSAVPTILSQTDLLVTVPEKLAQSAAQIFALASMKPKIKMPQLQTNIFWHKRFHQDPGNTWLRGLLAEFFSE